MRVASVWVSFVVLNSLAETAGYPCWRFGQLLDQFFTPRFLAADVAAVCLWHLYSSSLMNLITILYKKYLNMISKASGIKQIKINKLEIFVVGRYINFERNSEVFRREKRS